MPAIDHDLREIAQAQTEWSAWQFVCSELRRLEIDINQQTRLAVALRAWGEELVALRLLQSEDVRERCLATERQAIDRLPEVNDGPDC